MSVTVCIPTIPGRESLLSRLLWTLEPQLCGEVEVLVADGRRPMGDKLNEMFAAASGDYVVAVDDDDLLAVNYVERVATLFGADFLGCDILWLEDGRYSGTVKHHLDGDPQWGTLDRGVSPKCPVRTAIARRVMFGNAYTADRAWSAAVHEACWSGSYLPEPLYVYDHWNAHMAGTSPDDPRYRNVARDVGVWPYNREAFTWLA